MTFTMLVFSISIMSRLSLKTAPLCLRSRVSRKACKQLSYTLVSMPLRDLANLWASLCLRSKEVCILMIRISRYLRCRFRTKWYQRKSLRLIDFKTSFSHLGISYNNSSRISMTNSYLSNLLALHVETYLPLCLNQTLRLSRLMWLRTC